MKKAIFFVVMTIALALGGVFTAQADLKPNVVVSGFSIKEGSATVGKVFTLSLMLTNLEPSACAKTTTTSVQAAFPFILKGVTTLPAGDLCQGATATVDFPMRIDPTAVGGSYQLTITNNYETTTLAQFSSSDTLSIFVNGTPSINAYIVSSDPLDVYPGDTATLTLSLGNEGSFQAQSVTARMTADKPLDVKWANSVSAIGLLDAKQSKTAEFSVEVPKDAKVNDYGLDLEVQYLDENLVKNVKHFPFTFHVKEKALFETSDAGSNTLYANENSRTVLLLLTNTGTDAARKIKAKMLPQFPFSTDGSVRYADILEPGKTTQIQFTVNVDKDATPGTYGLDMLLDFEDAQGKSLQDTAKVSLVVKSKGFFRAVFLDYWFIWIVVLAVVVLVVIRITRGKKK